MMKECSSLHSCHAQTSVLLQAQRTSKLRLLIDIPRNECWTVAEQLVRPGCDWSTFFFPRTQLPLQEMSHYAGPPAQQRRFRQTRQWGGGRSGGSYLSNDEVMGCGGHDVMVPKSVLTRYRVLNIWTKFKQTTFCPCGRRASSQATVQRKNARLTAKSLVIKEAQTGSNPLLIL